MMVEYQPDRLTYWWGTGRASYVTDDFGNAVDIDLMGDYEAFDFWLSGKVLE